MTRNDRGALAMAFGQDIKESLPPSALKRHQAECIHD
jgi:hypothetical protein